MTLSISLLNQCAGHEIDFWLRMIKNDLLNQNEVEFLLKETWQQRSPSDRQK